MKIEVRAAAFADVAPLRAAFRAEAGCQIVHDSILERGLADPYRILVDNEEAGYGGVWNRYHPNRIMEVYVLPEYRPAASSLFRALVDATGGREMEAQTNIPRMHGLLEEFGRNVRTEKLLYEDGSPTDLRAPGVRFRRRRPDDQGPEGACVLERDGRVVAAGGVMTHYNPPYGDLYMEVIEPARRQGLGSYLIQELRGVCRQEGLEASARCDPDNEASRRTLERGGMVPCGRLVVAALRTPDPGPSGTDRSETHRATRTEDP